MRKKSLATIFVVSALIATACGSDDKTSSTTSPAAVTTPAASETTAAATTDTVAAEPATTAAGATDTTAAAGTDPIRIGAAIDLTGNMAPFDAPALASAQIAIKKINDAGGVMGRQLELKFVDTKLDPAATKAAAVDLITRTTSMCC